MDNVLCWWNNTKQMPWLLRTICRGAMGAGPILLVFAILPIADWTFNGKQMSYAEFWGSGAGIVTALFVGLVTVGSWGIAARQPRSRWALVFAPSLPCFLAFAFPQLRLLITFDAFLLAEALVTSAVVYGGLFHVSSVLGYFAEPIQ